MVYNVSPFRRKISLWRHIWYAVTVNVTSYWKYCFRQNIVMLDTVGELLLLWIRITIGTVSANEAVDSYSWFHEVTSLCDWLEIVSREPPTTKQSFYTLKSLESFGSIQWFIHFMGKKWVERPQKWEKPKKS